MNKENLGPNQGYIEELRRLYNDDPSLVSKEWDNFFSLSNGQSQKDPSLHEDLDSRLQEGVFRLLSAYRNFGHLGASINPILSAVVPHPYLHQLDPEYYNFSAEQLSSEVLCYRFQNQDTMHLAELVERLQSVYCGPIGFEYNYIVNPEERYWLREQIENRSIHKHNLSKEEIWKRITALIDAEVFEDKLHKNYIGQKRFSLEGGEALIPLLQKAIESAAEHSDVKEIVLGMAHRGRLNVLKNVLNKPLQNIFYEFEDKNLQSEIGSGDVKYHLGFESEHLFSGDKSVKLSLAANPSHLQFVYPVVQGICRGKQDRLYEEDRKSVLPIVLHGDAAFIGQGVTTETLNFSQVKGYQTGGCVHVIINNQIGFTTTTDESRSSVYTTAFANALEIPILHVNGEDIDAVCWAAEFALDYRNKFEKDIVIDLYCYRKHGHNEGDDPSFTQPLLYKEIRDKKLISEIYAEKIVNEGLASKEEVTEYRKQKTQNFQAEYEALRDPQAHGEACPLHGRLRLNDIHTAVSIPRLKECIDLLLSFPKDFNCHPKLKNILQKRFDNFNAEQGLDWGTTETLAYASLLQEGKKIRLTGQDVGRGTFSHRHILINDYETDQHHLTLQPLIEKYHAKFEAYNTTLSETGILGFEFGYSLSDQKGLIIWEAQFGDFANGAQVIIDQFISSSEEKWEQLSGIVALLPHGYEGQGPEHSSARLERFLQLCARGNMTVAYPTNAAQIFHLLRQQALSSIKRPLIVMSPKSLLRAKQATASLSDLTEGSFQKIMTQDFSLDQTQDCTLVLTTGKICYGIEEILNAQECKSVRVIRIENLYPLPEEEIRQATKDLKIAKYIWVQEEPLNMGAWLYIEPLLRELFSTNVNFVGRPVSASPATGSPKRHALEQEKILTDLLAVLK